MLFHTQQFLLVFLPLSLCGFYALARRPNARRWWLIVASLAFYGYWDLRLLPLLLVSIVLNWMLVRGARVGMIRRATAFGVVLNLVVLGAFKYANFFAETLAAIFPLQHAPFDIVLPLGISFFTFQQISYLIDLQRGAACRYRFADYALYVSFFPQLIAGPIVRHDEVIAQYALDPYRQGLAERLSRGSILLLLGLAKKLILADAAADLADPVFAAVAAGHALGAAQAWIGLCAFTVQIYFDFSAYSDMAIGIGALFGVFLPENFNAPYRARSIAQFWRCWHITLSSFLRDYLYIVLGGNRHGRMREYTALIVTMLLGGLWHGASWTFVVWGGVHGMALALGHVWRRYALPCPGFLGWLLTMMVVVLAWVLFRAVDFATAWRFYTALLATGSADSSMHVVRDLHSPLILLVAMVIATVGPTSQRLALILLPARRLVAIVAGLAMAVIVLVAGDSGSQEFIYFQF